MITISCTECKAKSQDGILEHSDKCSANLIKNKIETDYIRPPAIKLNFDTPEEQAEWYRKLEVGSGERLTYQKASLVAPQIHSCEDSHTIANSTGRCVQCGWPAPQIHSDETRKHFEANMLDGDKVQPGQMLASTEVLEYITDLLAKNRQAAYDYGYDDRSLEADHEIEDACTALLDRVLESRPPRRRTAAPRGKMMGFDESCINNGFNEGMDQFTATIQKLKVGKP